MSFLRLKPINRQIPIICIIIFILIGFHLYWYPSSTPRPHWSPEPESPKLFPTESGRFVRPIGTTSLKDIDPLLENVGRPPGKLWGPGERELANATLMALVRNEEVDGMVQSMLELEKTFNHKFNYPWTFLNDKPFSEEFKARTRAATKANISYELIPPEHWSIPNWINPDLLTSSFNLLHTQGVQYSRSTSYHQMCRWNSGLFPQHPALQKYRYYWRVEPKVHYFCDLDYDPFHFLSDRDMIYGFVIALYDSPASIANLWPEVQAFLNANPDVAQLHPNNTFGWLTDAESRPEHTKQANGYSTCHFWSNFEIGDMDFFRSEVYTRYFNHLDRTGGFFYERWGDAPVHSIALALFADKRKIHWFRDIGYEHIPYFNCPNNPGRCRLRGTDEAGIARPGESWNEPMCEPGRFTNGQGIDGEDCRANWFYYGGMH